MIEAVEEMLEQSDLSTAERALRSPGLLGKLRAADIGPAHAELVPAMELLAQVLMEKGKTKEAFTVGGTRRRWGGAQQREGFALSAKGVDQRPRTRPWWTHTGGTCNGRWGE